MRSTLLATFLALLLAPCGVASADDLGMRGLGDIVLLAQYYAAFFLLQFAICCVVATRRIYSGKRLSGYVYVLMPVETAFVSLLVIYFVTAFLPVGFFGSLLTMVLTPPTAWLLLHIALHRPRAANA
jgi:hypothetical protein